MPDGWENIAEQLLSGTVIGVVITTLVNAILQRRKIAADTNKVSVEASLLALNNSLDFLSKRVKDLDSENILLNTTVGRLENCIKEFEKKYEECSDLLKKKIEEIERWQASNGKEHEK